MHIAEQEHIGCVGHGQVFKFSAEQMRDYGLYVGPPRRMLRVPKGLITPEGWRPGKLVREPTMDEMLALGLTAEEIVDAGHNVACNAGINRRQSLWIAGGGQGYDNTHTAIGVGDGGGSAPVAAASDTELVAAVNAANRYFQMADGTYPSAASQVVTVQATFATGNGNFAWNEWAVDQHTASGATASVAPMLNHKGIALGTKTSASAWAFKITFTES